MALVGAALAEMGLLLKATGPVDQAFPMGIADLEADRGRGVAGLVVAVEFLGIGRAAQAQVEARSWSR
jgi:hypothetical protein